MGALSLGISVTAAAIRPFDLISAIGPILASAPSVALLVAQANITMMRTAGTYQSRGGGSVELSLSEWRIDDVPVGFGSDYTPTLTDVGGVLSYVEQASEIGGDADGVHPIVSVIVGTVLPAANIDEDAPLFTNLTAVQAEQDASLDVTISFTETENLPITCYIVGVLSGELRPTAEQIIAGRASDNTPGHIMTSFVTSVDGSTTEIMSDVVSGIYDLHAVAVDVSGNQSDIASVLGMTLDYSSGSHVFTDDFTTYANGTLLKDSLNYVEHSNTGTRDLEVQSNTLVVNGTGTCNLHLTYEGHVFSGDHYFDAVFNNAPDESSEAPVLLIGWQDTDNFYAARIRNTDVDIRRKLNGGNEDILASKTFTPRDGDTVRLERSGTDLLLTINGTLELSVADETFTGGKCGYRVFVSGAVNDPPQFSGWEFGEP